MCILLFLPLFSSVVLLVPPCSYFNSSPACYVHHLPLSFTVILPASDFRGSQCPWAGILSSCFPQNIHEYICPCTYMILKTFIYVIITYKFTWKMFLIHSSFSYLYIPLSLGQGRAICTLNYCKRFWSIRNVLTTYCVLFLGGQISHRHSS